MKTNKTLLALVAATLLGAAGAASAAPLGVSYTVSGSSGNWTLDFDVANNLAGTDQRVYFFGVQLDQSSPAGDPVSFDHSIWPTWNNAGYGGSATVYNDVWISWSSGIAVGSAVDGFLVHSTAAAAPTDVSWFAYAEGSVGYYGADAFYKGRNPGFESLATPSTAAVPEPANRALLLAGLGMMGVVARRRAAAR